MQLDKYQQAVVNADPQANIKVVGSPGSGKTRTLINRYSRLVIRHGIKPERILALTFSKKAADEMLKRVKLDIDISNRAQNNISTINAFCYRLYNNWRASVGDQPLKIWQYGDKVINPDFVASDLMKEHMGISDMSQFDLINKTLKSVPVPDASLLMDELEYSKHKADAAYKAWQKYESWMKENNLTDFYGQVWNVDRLMDKNPVFSMMVGRRFDKIIGDEFQDMFPQTYRIVLKLAKESSIELFADPSQSIYGFNGAAPYLFLDVEAFVPNMLTFHLSNNYRSGIDIVDVVNDFGPSTTESFQRMATVKQDRGEVILQEAECIPDQADYIADEIKRNKFDYQDVYVLARTNGQCSAIYQRLIELGIPANYAGNFSIWDKSHMKAGIGYMAIANDQDSPDDLSSIVNIPSENYVNSFGDSKGRYTPTRFLPKNIFNGRSFKDIVDGGIELSKAQRPGVSNIVKFVNYLKDLDTDRQRVGDIQAAISKWSQWTGGDYMAVEGDLSMLWDKLETLDYNVNYLRIYIQKLHEARRKIKKDSNKVQVMTIHQAKGLESFAVFLTGLSEPIPRGNNEKVTVKGIGRDSGFHPGRNTNVNINEENCLYYVGISRAIKYLYLTYYTSSGDIIYGPSSFITPYAKKKGFNDAQI